MQMSNLSPDKGAGLTGFRGPILHFLGDPLTKEPEKNYEYLEDGLLVVTADGGKVVACKNAAEAIEEFGKDLELVDCSGKVSSVCAMLMVQGNLSFALNGERVCVCALTYVSTAYRAGLR